MVSLQASLAPRGPPGREDVLPFTHSSGAASSVGSVEVPAGLSPSCLLPAAVPSTDCRRQ